jgi:DNA-directed RNA polymerase sigma subunit (sigma70/sigma32)
MDNELTRVARYYIQDFAPEEALQAKAIQHTVDACTTIFPLLDKDELQRAAVEAWFYYTQTHEIMERDAQKKQQMRDMLRRRPEILSERERQVIELRLGMLDGHIYSLEEVSKRLSITRERVYYLERRALAKLRDNRD